MGKILPFKVDYTDLAPDDALEGAKGKLRDVVIAGYDEDGDIYLAATQEDGAEILWLLEQFRMALMMPREGS
jgi:hypothetical protein